MAVLKFEKKKEKAVWPLVLYNGKALAVVRYDGTLPSFIDNKETKVNGSINVSTASLVKEKHLSPSFPGADVFNSNKKFLTSFNSVGTKLLNTGSINISGKIRTNVWKQVIKHTCNIEKEQYP